MGFSPLAGDGMIAGMMIRAERGTRRLGAWKGWCGCLGVAASLLLGGGPRAEAQSASDAHLLIVTGAPGEPRFAESFAASARTLRDAAGIPHAYSHVLAGSASTRDADGRATKDELSAALARLAERSSAGNVVTIVLIGHGSAGDVARFNLVGPDVSAQEFATWIRPLSDRRLTVVIAASASGDWVPALSAPGRVVISATRTQFERNESLFHTHFTAAFKDAAGDVDKDGRVSILEAFNHATREVARVYATSGRLQTEHALLDDDGDGVGSMTPGGGGADGALAARSFLNVDRVMAGSNAPAGADSLLQERARLEAAIQELRGRRDEMELSTYERELETLITRLAEIRRTLEPPREER